MGASLVLLLFGLYNPWTAEQTPPAPSNQNSHGTSSENQAVPQPPLIEETAPTTPTPLPGRILHFPKDHSVGVVTMFYGPQHVFVNPKRVDAEGDVFVPAGDKVLLEIECANIKDLVFLGRLQPHDVSFLTFEGSIAARMKFDDSDLVFIQRMTGLQGLPLSFMRITDQGLSRLTNLKSLEGLDLRGTLVTDEGLVHLKELTSLTSLLLLFTRIGDDGLEHIGQIKSLTHLYLEATRVTDAGLIHLQALTQLTNLSLSGPLITDSGLDHLKAVNSLREIILWGTNVTDGAVNSFRQALPNCAVYLRPTAPQHPMNRPIFTPRYANPIS